MKNNFLPILMILLFLLAGQAGASHWFKVINVTPIEMTANSDANFTVSVRGLGSERAYVELVFKNKTEGFNFACQKMIKNVFPGGVTDYNCTLSAGDVAAGNYSFVVDVSAKGAPSGKKTAFINVVDNAEGRPEDETDAKAASLENTEDSEAANQTPQEAMSGDEAGEEAEKTPMPGALTAVFCLLVLPSRMKRERY
jgi:hypothetical protein